MEVNIIEHSGKNTHSWVWHALHQQILSLFLLTIHSSFIRQIIITKIRSHFLDMLIEFLDTSRSRSEKCNLCLSWRTNRALHGSTTRKTASPLLVLQHDWAVAQLVEALHSQTGRRKFDSGWGHWNFSSYVILLSAFSNGWINSVPNINEQNGYSGV